MVKFQTPTYKMKAFNCVHCSVFSQQNWDFNYISKQGYVSNDVMFKEFNLSVSNCEVCNGKIIWLDEKIIFPKSLSAPVPIEGMPNEIKEIFDEARLVLADSPRSSCALLRLSVESLCNKILPSGNLNQKIGEMVKRGLDTRIQQSLDLVRIIGNEKVHPGQIDKNDTFNDAMIMFDLVNYITEKMIIEPKKIDDLFSNLPKSKIEQIEKRDSNKSGE
ncbi:MAG: DUF4145 domain-containing protein [Erysipelothrix sp.]|nr:DUF4145 domain-containing protein [Erysipelothrix sp.]